MKISSFLELKKLIQLCQNTGVDEITLDGITIKLGMAPVRPERKQTKSAIAPGGITDDTTVPFAELTPEQLLFYSAGDGGAN